MPVLPPELTHRQASATLQQLLAALAAVPGEEACVDARALRVFDSSALACMGCKTSFKSQAKKSVAACHRPGT